jgi:hypothetical protein
MLFKQINTHMMYLFGEQKRVKVDGESTFYQLNERVGSPAQPLLLTVDLRPSKLSAFMTREAADVLNKKENVDLMDFIFKALPRVVSKYREVCEEKKSLVKTLMLYDLCEVAADHSIREVLKDLKPDEVELQMKTVNKLLSQLAAQMTHHKHAEFDAKAAEYQWFMQDELKHCALSAGLLIPSKVDQNLTFLLEMESMRL